MQNRPAQVGSEVVRLLQEKREEMGFSMNTVAAKAGLSHTMISRVERKLRNPTLDTLLRISGAMGIELWPLIKEAEATAKLQALPDESSKRPRKHFKDEKKG